MSPPFVPPYKGFVRALEICLISHIFVFVGFGECPDD